MPNYSHTCLYRTRHFETYVERFRNYCYTFRELAGHSSLCSGHDCRRNCIVVCWEYTRGLFEDSINSLKKEQKYCISTTGTTICFPHVNRFINSERKWSDILSVQQKKVLKDIDTNLLFCYQQPLEKGVAINSIKILNNILHLTILFSAKLH